MRKAELDTLCLYQQQWDCLLVRSIFLLSSLSLKHRALPFSTDQPRLVSLPLHLKPCIRAPQHARLVTTSLFAISSCVQDGHWHTEAILVHSPIFDHSAPADHPMVQGWKCDKLAQSKVAHWCAIAYGLTSMSEKNEGGKCIPLQ